jgi:DNA polymerase III sliding clamp (beta) subunit (PCNA family)
MSDKLNLNRDALTKTVNMVRPALAVQAYVPVLQHICFDGGFATAFNDVTAIGVKIENPMSACLPGDLLARGLASFSSETINMAQGADGAITLSSGRAKLKIPSLPAKTFPFDRPNRKEAQAKVLLFASIIDGIDKCLMSVGTDTAHPAHMGVTLDIDQDSCSAILFSTDGSTISRYETTDEIPLEEPVILPTFFCQQLIALNKVFSKDDAFLYLMAGGLLVEWSSGAFLYSRTLVDLEPLEFDKVVERHVKLEGLKKRCAPIPDKWDAALKRALLITQGEVDKVTKILPIDGGLKMRSVSAVGDAEDSMGFEGVIDEAFLVDPALVDRAGKHCALLECRPKALVMVSASGNFMHLISHLAPRAGS